MTENENPQSEELFQEKKTDADLAPELSEPDNSKEVKKIRKGIKVFIIAMSAVVALALITCAAAGIRWKSQNNLPKDIEISMADKETTPSGSDMVPFIWDEKTDEKKELTPAEIYKTCSGSVVRVTTVGANGTGFGSGIVLSKDGYILTNAHMVDNFNNFKVKTIEGKEYSAILVGSDAQTDVAVLYVSADADWVPATFGDSDLLCVGDMVIAIGNPLSEVLSFTQTVGYVSGLNRMITTESGYQQEYIQMDTAINPGNSGGALINTSGQVVGLTNSKIVVTGYEAISFAIPSNKAIDVAKNLIRNGKVSGRAMLGINAVFITPEEAAQYGIVAGIQVVDINDGADIGNYVQENDIITSVDGWAITSFADVSFILAEHEPGDMVEIQVYRMVDNRAKTFSAKITLTTS